jgi:hypothetical protein
VQGRVFQRTLEEVLNQFAPMDQVWRIDQLELNVQFSNGEDFQLNFSQSLKQTLQDLQVKHALGDVPELAESTSLQRLDQVLYYFLQHGYLPWNSRIGESETMRAHAQVLVQQPHAPLFQQLWSLAKGQSAFWQRLFVVLSPSSFLFFRKQFFYALDRKEEYSNQLDTLENRYKGLSNSQQLDFANSLIRRLAELDEGEMLEQFLPDIQTTLEQATSREIPASKISSHNSDAWPAEGIWIKNAGVVLLASHIGTLIKRLGWLGGKIFSDAQTQQKAIALLQFLVFGDTEMHEEDLVLNKILCNWPVEAPLGFFETPDVEIRAEAENLLKSVIEEWTALKKTSIANLRHSFLQRDGKLTQRADGCWHLHIERKTLDILLDRLPPGWSFSVIKFPWMNYMLFVEW